MLHGLTPRAACRLPVTARQAHVVRPGQRRRLLTLAIESSCDDTCVAILEKKSVLDDTTHHNIAAADARQPPARLYFNQTITARNGGHRGIHPIVALESHHANLASLVARSLARLPDAMPGSNPARCLRLGDGTLKQKPDFVTVTRGPGMRSQLNCGLNTAKGLAVAWQVPLVGAHHMQAHALTPRLMAALRPTDPAAAHDTDSTPAFPFLSLLVSGGHTMLLLSKGLTDHTVLVNTADVAIGDTLDKSGRCLLSEDFIANLSDTSYGKYLSEFAFASVAEMKKWPLPQGRGDEINKPLNQYGWQLQTPLSDTRDMVFSFTSIYTRMETLFRARQTATNGNMTADERILFARTVLATSFEHLASRTIIALEKLQASKTRISTLVVSGGVAANSFLRYYLRAMLDTRGFKRVNLVFPPAKYCTDNAAMIAWCGMEMFEAGYASSLEIDAVRKWSMDPASEEGGIFGVGGWLRREAS